MVYENEQYSTMKEILPKEGQRVSTSAGVASVIGINPLKETVMVELESQAVVELPASEVTVIGEQQSPKRARKRANKR